MYEMTPCASLLQERIAESRAGLLEDGTVVLILKFDGSNPVDFRVRSFV